MVRKQSCLYIFQLLLFSACISEKPEIRAICETNDIGDYIIKWETFPQLEGTVKIYETFPDNSKDNIFLTEQPTKDGITTIFGNKTNGRRYFELIFNKKHSYFVAERLIKTNSIFNLRDIGGYFNKDKRQIKWGMIYRSSTLVGAKKKDIQKINDLGTKTIIDIRTQQEIKKYPVKIKAQQNYTISMEGIDTENFQDKINKDEMKRGDVLIMQQDLYFNLLTQNREKIIQLFDILLEKNNYPILIHCSLGKDRTGLVVALILASLDISKEQISQDYMLSNNYINFNQLASNASDLSFEAQEALTALLGTNEKTMEYVFNKITKDYGSFNNYLEKELGIDEQKKEKLKELLLY